MPHKISFLLLTFILSLAMAAQAQYEPNWASLDRRTTPVWFDEAKFGIFIHWGVYSVPAWGPKGTYAEWYWRHIESGRANLVAQPELRAFWEHHQRFYGANFSYRDFAPQFKAELFDADQWADLFARAGAKYVVLTTKHHDGFTLWPSAQSEGWNAVAVGPRRDLVGDLSKSVKARNLKMGLYYSLYEWFHPDYREQVNNDGERRSVGRYVNDHMHPQLRDLVTRYQPALLWADGDLDHNSSIWQSADFLAWLYNNAANPNELVVNDRWGKDARSRYGSFFTREYGKTGVADTGVTGGKWEDTRGMGYSFGYNRNEDVRDYTSATELIHELIETVSRGGNFLLDIGPTADGRIPIFMQDRLLEIGNWLNVNGEAIYATTPWRVTGEADQIFYTRKGTDVYAFALRWPGSELTLKGARALSGLTVRLLGHPAPLNWRNVNGNLTIEMPSNAPANNRHAYVFKLNAVE
ncbi:MAG: alpha-L-fucosidase [Acidobacteria bacterium]|nr:alpha-L-fucosidase [Acidobacteriota bacterium]